MLFNSYPFLFFVPIVFLLYWNIRNLRYQNLFLILASYIFYGWWDWRFLGLIIFSSSVDFVVGRRLAASENEKGRKRLYIERSFLATNILRVHLKIPSFN
jgi:D-alanyl-lipoteichoic acid acyltransferase DltB (MBOAT superfamily)